MMFYMIEDILLLHAVLVLEVVPYVVYGTLYEYLYTILPLHITLLVINTLSLLSYLCTCSCIISNIIRIKEKMKDV